MKNRNVLVLAAVLALPLGTMACSNDEPDPAEQLHGDWRTGEGLPLLFEPDGTWSVADGVGQEPFDTGTFTFDGSTLTVDTDESSESCAGQTGTYEVAFIDPAMVALEPIEEECGARGSDFQQGLTRVEE
ncbi:MAG: hypothetical protein IZT58_14805 [Actinobacteria bacterium]|nr:hypothetical protein [Actinomycetota bacterium]